MISNTEFTYQLPGGRCYQKGGARLEQALYNCFPNNIKKYIKRNLRPKNANGDIIVEFDMIYYNEKAKQIISFEVKGLNDRIGNCPEKQNKIFNQTIRQKYFLTETFAKQNIQLATVVCFVTGKKNTHIDPEFLNKFVENDIIVSVGITPNDVIKEVIIKLKSDNFFNDNTKNSVNCNFLSSLKKSNYMILIPTKQNAHKLLNKCISYADVLKTSLNHTVE